MMMEYFTNMIFQNICSMMKQSKEMVISFVLLAFLCSCNNNDRLIKEVQALSGRKITLNLLYVQYKFYIIIISCK